MKLRLLMWSLRHRKRRRLVDVLTIAVTSAVIMVFVAVMLGLLAYVRKSTENPLTRILVKQKLIDSDLPMTMYQTLKGIEGVQVVERFKALQGRHESGATYYVIAEEDVGVELTPDLLPVTPDVLAAWKAKKPMGAIVTEQTARDLGLSVGETAEVPTSRGPLRIEVVGISHGATLAQRIAPHFEYVMQWLGNPGTCRFRVFAKPDDYAKVARGIEEATRNSGTPLQAINAEQYAASVARQGGIVPALLGFLGVFLILTATLTLANNSAISIRERRVEIATFRVLGYRRNTLLGLLIGESLVIGLLAGVLTVVITWFAFRNGVQMISGEAQFMGPITMGKEAVVAGLVTSLVLPMVGALPSAIAAIRTQLIDGLRDTA